MGRPLLGSREHHPDRRAGRQRDPTDRHGLERRAAGALHGGCVADRTVDAGVGGRAAVGIGRRLARLARSRQVVVVTHLPQVAAFADRHVRVAKSVAPGRDGEGGDGLVTVSGVSVLDDEARVAELARMLAGQEDSATARAHAAELLALPVDEAGAVPAR